MVLYVEMEPALKERLNLLAKRRFRKISGEATLAIEKHYEKELGMDVWTCGRIDLRPGVGVKGQYRVVVIDLEKRAAMQDGRGKGTRPDTKSPPKGQIVVTWTEAGGVVIVGHGETADPQRWRWSQPSAVWEEGGCPPAAVLDALFTALA